MTLENRLRSSLIRKIQNLSTDKLLEVNKLLAFIDDQKRLKDVIKNLAGSWKNLSSEVFADFTDKLHENRSRDRQILITTVVF